ncbi:unnamed protein product [Caenorhabditis auriculariae]|uniref:Major facilitator superfamily (MFS) profile domain-containing protein n=1 Tax=Caenorhabditis auriculariae TaxID=2777116 RepID=A0A8S1GNU2_9PELO|nr:unnamed protein product [Caenorhabditis auriculariae]
MYSDFQMLLFSTIPGQLNTIFSKTLMRYGFEPTTAMVSIVSSLIATSMGFGMLFCIFFIVPLMDSRGRKFVCVTLRFFIGSSSCIFQLLAAQFNSAEFFFVGQILVGCNYPIRLIVTIMFVGECAADKNRGFATTTLIVCDVLASLVMYSTSSPSVLGNDSWFIYPLASFFMSLALFVTTAGLPESPKWLVRKNEHRAAALAIRFYQDRETNLVGVYEALVRENNLTKSGKISLREVCTDPTLREALKIVIAVQLFLVTSPVPVERMYTVVLHNTLGLSVDQSLNVNFFTSLIFAPARFVGSYVIDIVGRRFVVYMAGAIMYLKVLIMAFAQFVAFEYGPCTLTRILVIVSEALSELITATGISALATLLIVELFPPAARVSVAQINVLLSMISALPLVTLYPILNAIFPPAFYVPLMILQPFFIFFLHRRMPETKARAVCDIVAELDSDVRSRATTMYEYSPLIRIKAKSYTDLQNMVIREPRRPRASTVTAPDWEALRELL